MIILNSEKLTTSNGKILDGPLILTPNIFEDERGFFYESWNKRVFDSVIQEDIVFLQDSHSRSSRGVLRGLHYQLPPMEQEKLVRCTNGSIFDVAVDLRKNSPTYHEWGGIKLSSQNKKQLWIPKGFAHGFLTLSEYAEVEYKSTNFWNKEFERSIRWDDSSIKIEWPLIELEGANLLISQKDEIAAKLSEAEAEGDIFK